MILNQRVDECPECGSKRINYQPERAEISCRNCGFVISDNLPLVETYDGVVDIYYSTKKKKLKFFLPDVLRSVEERTMKAVVGDLKSMNLGLKGHQKKEVLEKYVELYRKGWTKGRNRRVILAALVFLILRKEEDPILLEDFSFIIEPKRILKYAKKISRKTDLKLIPGKPKNFISRFGHQLGLPEYLITSALTVYKRLKGGKIFRNRSYKTVALACLLVASKAQGLTFNKEEVSSIAKVDLTVQSELRRDIREKIGLEKILRISKYFE